MSGNAYVNDRTYQRSEFDSDGSPEPVLRLPKNQARPQKGILISRSQMFLFWSAIAGMMVFVFVVGFHAGRSKGRESLLEEVSREAVRLPIVSPMAVDDNNVDIANAGLANIEATNEQAASENVELSANEKLQANAAALDEGDTKFDFAGSVELSKRKEETKSTASNTSKKKTTDVVKTSPLGTKVVSGWYIQVEAAKNLSEVTSIEKVFAAKGFNPVVHRGKLRGQVYYQVILGPYKTRDSALTARTKVKKSKLSRIEPFVRRF